ncbi:MAG: heavy metal-responsive transcriptional regulator [Phototrophicales bacterium]|nr:MAG: heavy metal-responsive transcriptional regulator [Phototrophicales bacterium]
MLMTRGELAKRCGVNPETIRYYERSGLLIEPQRSDAGYRLFDEAAAERLHFVKRAQSAGFTLDEIKTLLDIQNAPDSTCGDVRSLTEHKIAQIDERIRLLTSMRALLVDLLEDCPGGERPLEECPILDNFNG